MVLGKDLSGPLSVCLLSLCLWPTPRHSLSLLLLLLLLCLSAVLLCSVPIFILL